MKEILEAVKEIESLRIMDENIENDPDHCQPCNCNCACHPCAHTSESESEKPYFPSNRTI